MGFSSALQGKVSHEALLARQDAEIRLLETMKRCLTQKAKCDKEYAITLANVAQQGLKIDRTDDLQGSHITKAWRTIMEELEQQSKQIRFNSEQLEVLCSDKITQLYQDKRKSRKLFQEEHQKIAAQFTHLTEDVARKKAEYQKHLEYYKLLRTRFEEHYIKSGRAGRKLDDVREKYQKACRKLHLAHNEYVLLINEAIEVEKDIRTILLPSLLEHQQSLQENFLTTWKNLLVEAANLGDFTSDKFLEIQERIDASLHDVNPANECQDFCDKSKSSSTLPVLFRFDDQLIEDNVGKLQPNTLTVDNLTVDWLRQRLNDLENSVRECQDKQNKLLNESNGNLTNSVPTSPTSINSLSNSINGSNGSSNNLKDSVNKFSKDLSNLRCQERQMQKLIDLIRSALNDVACEELPSGCDDISVEIDNNIGNQEQPTSVANTSSFLLQKSNDFMTLVKAPFKKRQTIAGTTVSDGNSKKSTPNGTPKSLRSDRRASSGTTSSVNSISEDCGETNKCFDVCEPINTDNNIANDPDEILDVPRNSPTDIPSTPTPIVDIEVLKVPLINECQEFEECVEVDTPPTPLLEINSSTNNLLELEEKPSMTSSIDCHLDQIDRVNRNLDKILEAHHHQSISESTKESTVEKKIVSHDTIQDRIRFKDKIADKLKILKESRLVHVSSDDLKNRIKKINVFKKQSSQEDGETSVDTEENSEEAGTSGKTKRRALKLSKSIFSSFREKKKGSESPGTCESPKPLEIEEEFEEVGNENYAHSTLLTDLDADEEDDEASGSTGAGESSGKTRRKIKAKLRENFIKLNKKLAKNKIFSKKLESSDDLEICRKCSKRKNSIQDSKIHPSKAVFDFNKEFDVDSLLTENEFCLCEIDDETDDGEVLSIKRHDTNSSNASASITTNRPLYDEEWFHGVLPREEVVRLLRNEGDFLVRETTRNDESQTVLSVCWNGHKHFIVQTTSEGHFRFEGPSFPSIQELILHQYQSELPVTSRSGAILKKPVLRERWELSNDDVILIDKIGRGNFGDVYKAKLKSTKKDVAVKTCRMTLPDEQKRKFLQEGRILKQYDHPNIVKLIGICVQKQPIMIVMELVPGGSLLMFLRKNALTMTERQMMSMCKDTAAGMRYLESKNCIHRDLAARNCLIGNENIVKISDFGMSREEEEYIVSDGMKQIPIKWTAPEALNFGKYTSLCDVWSYGVLIWEIFSKGGTPYSGMSNSRARERIDEGYRMSAPDNTPPEMYRLMLKCWSYEPENRPHFDEIYTVVDALLAQNNSSPTLTNGNELLTPIKE